MNGELAQYVALVCHGNAFLRGFTVPDLLASNSTCQFCDSISFIKFDDKDGAQEEIIASTPNKWFESLRQNDVYGLRLAYASQNDPRISDRLSAGFVGGGGVRTIEVVQKRGMSQFYRSRWTVWNKTAPDRRIWRVTYGRIAEGKTLNHTAKPLGELKAELKNALQDIHAFSVRLSCEPFTRLFANALESLSSPTVRHGYHNDLYNATTLSADAMSLLDACQTAWVFGGMGSWNDMGFDGDDGREYTRVSDNLFRLITETVPAVANDSFRDES